MTPGRNLRIGEALLGFGVLGLGLFIGIQTAMLQVGPTHATVGPRLFPLLVAAGLLIVGVALLREALAGHIAHEGGWELDWSAVGLISAGLIVEMLVMEAAGWIVAATFLFVAVARAFGSRRLAVDAAVGLVLASLTFAVFSYGLDLGLPAGLIGELMAPADPDAD
jgi:putative tricarboxylic transport membrane protein